MTSFKIKTENIKCPFNNFFLGRIQSNQESFWSL